MGKIKTLLLVFAVILCTSVFGGCGCSCSKDVEVNSIVLENEEMTNGKYYKHSNVNSSFTISYILNPENTTQSDISISISNTQIISTDYEIVKNANRGVITFETLSTVGITDITIHTEGNKFVVCEINVHDSATVLSTPTFNESAYSDVVQNYVTHRRVGWNNVNTNTLGDSINDFNITYKVAITNLDKNVTFTKIVDTNYFDFDLSGANAMLLGDTYSVNVQAIGNTYDFLNSTVSGNFVFSKLDIPKNIKINNGIVSFDNVSEAQTYEVRYFENLSSIISNGAFNFAVKKKTNNEDINTYNISICARQTNTNSTDSYFVSTKMIFDKSYAVRVYNSDFSSSLTVNRLLGVQEITLNNQFESKFSFGSDEFNGIYNSAIVFGNSDFENKIYSEFLVTLSYKNNTKEYVSNDCYFELSPAILSELEVVDNQSIVITVQEIVSDGYENLYISSSLKEKTVKKYFYNASNFESTLSVENYDVLNLSPHISEPGYVSAYQVIFAKRNGEIFSNVNEVISGTFINLQNKVDGEGIYGVYVNVLGNESNIINGGIFGEIFNFEKLKRVKNISLNYKGQLEFEGPTNHLDYILTYHVDASEYEFSISAAFLEEYNNKYFVNLNNTELYNGQSIAGVMENGKLLSGDKTISIYAKGNDIKISSAKSIDFQFEKLQTPTEISDGIWLQDKTLRWNKNQNYSYEIILNDLYPVQVGNSNSFDFDLASKTIQNYLDNNFVGTQLNFKIYAISELGSTCASLISDSLEYSTVRNQAVNNVSVQNGVLTWGAVADCKYKISYSNGTTTSIKTISLNSSELDDINDSNVYSVRIQTIKDNTFASVFSDEYFVKKLTIVNTITVGDNRNYIVWDEVAGASVYKISVNENIYQLEQNIFDMSTLIVEGSNNITLKAIGNVDSSTNLNSYDTPAFLNSKTINKSIVKLAVVTNLEVFEGVLRWQFEENFMLAGFYIILEQGEHVENIFGGSFDMANGFWQYDISDNIATWSSDIEIEIKMMAVGNLDYVINSNRVEITTKKLGGVTLSIQEGNVIITKADSIALDGENFVIYKFDSQNQIISSITTNEQIVENLGDLENVNYIKVERSCAGQFLNSELSNRLDIEKQRDLSGFEIDNVDGKICWNKDSKVKKYFVTVENNSNTNNFTVEADEESSYVFFDIVSDWTAGNVNLTIVPGGNDTYLNGNVFSKTILKLNSPTFSSNFLTNNCLMFNGNNNYIYFIDVNDSGFYQTNITFGYDFNQSNDLILEALNNASTQVSIKVQARGESLSNDIVYSDILIKQVAISSAPLNLKTENGILEWNNVTGASYKVIYASTDLDKVIKTVNTNNYNFVDITDTLKTYKVNIIRCENNKIYSSASEDFYIKKLNAINSIVSKYDDRSVLEWNQIVGAKDYSIWIDGTPYGENLTNSFDFPAGLIYGNYTVKIVVNGEDTDSTDLENPAYLKSTEYTTSINKLNNVSSITINNNIASWNFNSGKVISKFEMLIENVYGGNSNFTIDIDRDLRNYDINDIILQKNWSAGAQIKVSLRAISDDDTAVSGNYASSSIYKKLNAPTVFIQNGVVVWANNNSAGGNYTYVLNLYNNEELKDSFEIINADTYNFNDYDLDEITDLKIFTKLNGWINSDFGNTLSIAKVDAVSDVFIDNLSSTIKWDKVQNAVEYDLKIYFESTMIINTTLVAGAFVDEEVFYTYKSTWQSGVYTVKIICKGGNALLNGAEFTDEIVKLPVAEIRISENKALWENLDENYSQYSHNYLLSINGQDNIIDDNYKENGTYSYSNWAIDLTSVNLKLKVISDNTKIIYSNIYELSTIKLSTPELYVENGILKWNGVGENVKYVLHLFNSELIEIYKSIDFNTTNTYFNFDFYDSEIAYIKIQALPSNLTDRLYSNISDVFSISKLSTAINFNVERNNNFTENTYFDDYYTINWKAVEFATSYKIEINGSLIDESLYTNAYNLYVENGILSYTFRVIAFGVDSNNVLKSDSSEYFTVQVLECPEITIENNIILWTAVQNATHYELNLIYNNIVEVIILDNTYLSYAGANLNESGYLIKIKAVYIGQLDILDSVNTSNENASTITKLQAINILAQTGEIYWITPTTVTDVSYIVYENGEIISDYTLSSEGIYTKLNFKNLSPGVIKFNICIVVRKNGLYLDSEISNKINVEKLAAINGFTRNSDDKLEFNLLKNGNTDISYYVVCNDLNTEMFIRYNGENWIYTYQNIDFDADLNNGKLEIITPEIAQAGSFFFTIFAKGYYDTNTSYAYLNSSESNLTLKKLNIPKSSINFVAYDSMDKISDIAWSTYSDSNTINYISYISISLYAFNEVENVFYTTPQLTQNVMGNTTTNFSTLNLNPVLPSGKYKLELKYVSNNYTVLDSNVATVEIYKTASPIIQIQEGTIVWNGLNTDIYIVTETFNEQTYNVSDFIEFDTTLNKWKYVNPNWSVGDYKINLIKTIYSQLSADTIVYEFSKLNNGLNFDRDNAGKIIWNASMNFNDLLKYNLTCSELNFDVTVSYNGTDWVYNYNGIQVAEIEDNLFKIDTPAIEAAGEYIFKMRVIGTTIQEINYVNSDFETFSIIKADIANSDYQNFVNNGILMWNNYRYVKDETISAMLIEVYNSSEQLAYSTTLYDIAITSLDLQNIENVPGGVYSIKFTYISGNIKYVLNSQTISVAVEKLNRVEPSIVSGVVTFAGINGVSYLLTESSGKTQTIFSSLSGNFTYVNNEWMSGATYFMNIIATKSGRLKSDTSVEVTVVKLKTITDFNLDYNGSHRIFTWTPEQDNESNFIATKFLIKDSNDYYYYINSPNGNIMNLPNCDNIVCINYSIQAIGSNVAHSNLGVSGYVNSNLTTLVVNYVKNVDNILLNDGLFQWDNNQNVIKYSIEIFENPDNLDDVDGLNKIISTFTFNSNLDLNNDALIQSALQTSTENNFIMRINAIHITQLEYKIYLALSGFKTNNITKFIKFSVEDVFADFKVSEGNLTYEITDDIIDKINTFTEKNITKQDVIDCYLGSLNDFELLQNVKYLYTFVLEINGITTNYIASRFSYNSNKLTFIFDNITNTGRYDIRIRSIGNSTLNSTLDNIMPVIRSEFSSTILAFKPATPICPVGELTSVVNNNLIWQQVVDDDGNFIESGYYIDFCGEDDSKITIKYIPSNDELYNNINNGAIILPILNCKDYITSESLKKDVWYGVIITTVGTSTTLNINYDALLISNSNYCTNICLFDEPDVFVAEGNVAWLMNTDVNIYEIIYTANSFERKIYLHLQNKGAGVKFNVYNEYGESLSDFFEIKSNGCIVYSFQNKSYASGIVNIKVRAIGDAVNTISSDYFESDFVKLNKAQVYIQNGMFNWTEVWNSAWNSELGILNNPNILYYIEVYRRYLSDDEYVYELAGTNSSYNYYLDLLDAFKMSHTSGAIYEYYVKVFGRGENNYLNSDTEQSDYATRLSTISGLEVDSNGTITIIPPNSSAGINYYQIKNNNAIFETLNANTSTFTLLEAGGTFNLQIKCLPNSSSDEYLNSVSVGYYNLIKLSKPEISINDQGLISWQNEFYANNGAFFSNITLKISGIVKITTDGITEETNVNLVFNLQNNYDSFDLSKIYTGFEKRTNNYLFNNTGNISVEFMSDVQYNVSVTFLGNIGVLQTSANTNSNIQYIASQSSTKQVYKLNPLEFVNTEEVNSGYKLSNISGYEDINNYFIFSTSRYDYDLDDIYDDVVDYKIKVVNNNLSLNVEYSIQLAPHSTLPNFLVGTSGDLNITILLNTIYDPNDDADYSNVLGYVLFNNNFIQYGETYIIEVMAIKLNEMYTRSNSLNIIVGTPAEPENISVKTNTGMITFDCASSNVKFLLEYEIKPKGATEFIYQTVYLTSTDCCYAEIEGSTTVYKYYFNIKETTENNDIKNIKIKAISLINESYTSEFTNKNGQFGMTLFDSGDGRAENPYIINSNQQFYNINYLMSLKNADGDYNHFKLNNNITLTGYSFINIGMHNVWENINLYNYLTGEFKGVLDGNSKTVTVNISDNGGKNSFNNGGVIYYYDSIFNKNSGTIKDVNVSYNVTVNATNYANYIFGGLCFENMKYVAGGSEISGNISNITCTGNITTLLFNNVSYAAPITYRNVGNISNCINQTIITASDNGNTTTGTNRNLHVSGLVVINDEGGLIYQCGNEGYLTGALIGGLCVENYSTINESYNKGTFTLSNYLGRRSNTYVYAGGLVLNHHYGTISKCYNNNILSESTGEVCFGGLVYHTLSGSNASAITYCYNYNNTYSYVCYNNERNAFGNIYAYRFNSSLPWTKEGVVISVNNYTSGTVIVGTVITITTKENVKLNWE